MKVAQTQLEADFPDKNVADIAVAVPTTDNDKWDGDLIIEGYRNLTSIDLTGHSIDRLVVRDCPKLKDLDLNRNDTKKIDLSQLTLDASGKAIANTTLENFWANFNDKLVEINLKNCTKIKDIKLNDCGEIKKFEGGEDFDESLATISYRNTHGLSFSGTDRLKELKGAKEAVDIILGGEELKFKPDPRDPSKKVVDVDATKSQLLIKSSENPDSPAKNELDAIKVALGLPISATEPQILEEIKRLKDIGSSSDYISKVSLTSDAKNSLINLGLSEADISKKLSAAASAREVEVSRNKLVSDRFNELQSKLNNAHYLNIGLGTLSVGILVILTWMILKDRKLLPDQEDEEVKE